MPELLLGALVVDALVGDPRWLFRRIGHPVTWMGRLIEIADRRLNRPGLTPAALRLRGGLVLLGLAGTCGLIAWAIGSVLGTIPFGWIGEILVVATLLAGRGLYDHVQAVRVALTADGLESARHAVAKIVGRDVSELDLAGVCRAAIESLAESFSDGVVGPALAYLAFGLPGIAAYKAVSTADSMIGNRDERYRSFGWAAARTDDLFNLVPARLTTLLIALAAGRDAGLALATAWRDARRHASPNAGWPEAAMAGALGLRLGGPRRYDGLELDGAWLGRGRPDAGPDDIGRGLRLYSVAMGFIAGMLALAALALN